MERTLIVAEKPAQAREYASALGVRSKGQGYLENDQYVITWCVGHLLELERPEAYMDLKKVGKRWSLKRLPVLPTLHSFRRTIKPGTIGQFQVLKSWLESPDIKQVICGTDADREGQLLFQEVWDLVKCKKLLSRLWISSLTREAILEGMGKLLSEQAVAGLAAAGYGRTFADWDFGMNLTEGFTALFGSFDAAAKKPNVISIGRVQTPTLALIVRREWEIEHFIPEAYFEIRAYFEAEKGRYSGRWFDPGGENKRLTDRRAAEIIAAKAQGNPGKIIRVEQKKISETPPLLFELTSLTVAASKRFGMSAEKVLELAQALYEKKAITYPRTDCAYLPEDLIPKLPAHLQAVRQGPYLENADEALKLGVPQGKRVINTITAHHAIIPTTERINPEKLSEAEGKLFDLIVRRFLAVWFPSALYEQTEIITETAQELFRTQGKVMLNPGWKRVYYFEDLPDSKGQKRKARKKAAEKNDNEDDIDDIDDIDDTEDHKKNGDHNLPPVHQGESVLTKEIIIEEKTTRPPKRFTQGDLLKSMESAGKQIEDEVLRQQMKGKGLGTVATRPAIIENLLQRGYISQEQKVLKPTAKGTELISLIQNKLPEARLLISAEMTGQLEFDLAQVEKGELTLDKYMGEVEEAVIRILNELRTYEQKHGRTPLALAPAMTAKTAGSSRISGTSKSPVRPEVVPEVPAVKPSGETSERLGPCPRCGGKVIEGKKGYGCSNWKNGCSFVVWKKPICGKILTKNQMKSLLKKGKTPLIKGFKSQNGSSFAARLVWEDAVNGKLKFGYSKS